MKLTNNIQMIKLTYCLSHFQRITLFIIKNK